VPFSISHSDGFYDLAEIEQVELLLELAAERHNSLALVGALRSPVFGLSDRDLLELGKELSYRWEELVMKSGQQFGIADRVRRWLRYSEYYPQSRALELLFRVEELARGYQAAGVAEQYGNIERLLDQLRTAELRGEIGISAQAALSWLRSQRVGGRAAPRANSRNHPVVLTTVHGAKGLEYPVVILPFLSDRSLSDHDFISGELIVSGDRRRLLALKTQDESEDYRRSETALLRKLKREQALARAAEERRVFYVACTRARELLVLSLREGSGGWEREPSPDSTAPADWLRGVLS
jgi:ATP-dependent helicase/nuclease subunit A